MKTLAHSEARVIINLSAENKIHKNEKSVAFPSLDETARCKRVNFATLSRVYSFISGSSESKVGSGTRALFPLFPVFVPYLCSPLSTPLLTHCVYSQAFPSSVFILMFKSF